jgi:predicted HTH domain antitoxin
MTMIQVPCSEEILISLKEDPSAFANDLRMSAAVKFYEMGRLSSGRAAELAGVPRVVFLRRMSEYGASAWDLSRAELTEDLGNA